MVYAGREFVAMDKYLCDWSGADRVDDLSVETVAVGGIFDFGSVDWSVGVGRWVVGIYDW